MKKHIKQFILILAVTGAGGFLLTFLFMAFYGAETDYRAGQLIFPPSVIEKISFNDLHPSSGNVENFIFDHTEFVYFDYLRGQWQQKEIQLKQYTEFYETVLSDINVEHVTEEILQLFQKAEPIALVTTVRTLDSSTAKIFQIIQFTKENYFRIKLQNKENLEQWVYFYHPNLSKTIKTLFTTR